jgi:hypothetical protein
VKERGQTSEPRSDPLSVRLNLGDAFRTDARKIKKLVLTVETAGR